MGKPKCLQPSRIWCIKFKDPSPPAGRDVYDGQLNHYIQKKLKKVYTTINNRRKDSC